VGRWAAASTCARFAIAVAMTGLFSCSALGPSRKPSQRTMLKDDEQADAVYALQRVDLSDCYFSPPAGSVRAALFVDARGYVEFASLNGPLRKTALEDCVVQRLSGSFAGVRRS
jgi:hypothetical protein